jgi:hypothetical protein
MALRTGYVPACRRLMARTHDPFSALTPRSRAVFALSAIIASVVLSAVMAVIDEPLQNHAAPLGIVSFELAWSTANAQAILASWDAPARVYAGLILGLDYLYLLVYSTAVAATCAWAARRHSGRWHALGIGLCWGQWLAALCDASENLALIRILLGSTAAYWPPLAAGFASVKFGLIVAGLLYCVLSYCWPRSLQ